MNKKMKLPKITPYKELSDRQIDSMSDSNRLREIERAFDWMVKNFIPPELEDLDQNAFYKELKPPFNKNTIKRLERNAYLYVCFTDIAQRLIKE